MLKDKRAKGCPNEKCSMHKEKKKQGAENEYCPKCGTRLIYVCSKCFTEIEDIGPSHKKCRRCEIEAAEKKKKALDNTKKAATKAGAVAVAIGGPIVANIAKGGKQEAVKTGSKIVKEVVNKIPKIPK